MYMTVSRERERENVRMGRLHLVGQLMIYTRPAPFLLNTHTSRLSSQSIHLSSCLLKLHVNSALTVCLPNLFQSFTTVCEPISTYVCAEPKLFYSLYPLSRALSISRKYMALLRGLPSIFSIRYSLDLSCRHRPGSNPWFIFKLSATAHKVRMRYLY